MHDTEPMPAVTPPQPLDRASPFARRATLVISGAILAGSFVVFGFAWAGNEFATLHAEVQAARQDAEHAERIAIEARVAARGAAQAAAADTAGASSTADASNTSNTSDTNDASDASDASDTNDGRTSSQ